MNVYLPSELLKPFVHSYRIIESTYGQVNRVLPTTSLVMAFRYRGKVSYEVNDTKSALTSSVISGLRKSGRLMNYEKDTANLLVQLHETGANAFIKEPLYELFEESVSLDCFAGYNDLSGIEEQLAEVVTNQQRIHLIEQFLLNKLCPLKPDALVMNALQRIHAAKGIVRIEELASKLCISQDAFEKRFRRVVGVAPKQFATIVRMKSVISNSVVQNHRLAELAYDAGYFDQSHFNKDFRLFTGQTPTDFFKSPLFW